MGPAARAALPDFDGRLADARGRRDQLLRERRASRPVRWRLVEAEHDVNTKTAAAEKVRGELDDLLEQRSALEERIEERRLALARTAATGFSDKDKD